MLKQHTQTLRWTIIFLFMALFNYILWPIYNSVAIKYGLSMAPMEQKIILNVGDSQETSFTIANPISATEDAYYELTVEPFYVDEVGNNIFEAEGDSGEIVKWITFNIPTEGKIAPNEIKEVTFTINVPKDAPAGGQYAVIFVTIKDGLNKNDEDDFATDEKTPQMGINEIRRMGHLVYAEVAGTTVRKGEILEAKVPGFLFSGNIKGLSLVKNLGNVHSDAKYILRVFPLFSDEEMYSNEEKPEQRTILPNRALYGETVWDKTPGIGIFRVIYTVEFEGSTAEVSRIVIICPLWLLFIIVFAIIAIIIYFVARAKARKKEQE